MRIIRIFVESQLICKANLLQMTLGSKIFIVYTRLLYMSGNRLDITVNFLD